MWTNGSVTASDAVSLAAKLIRDHLNIFITLEETGDQAPEAQADQPRAGSEPASIASSSASSRLTKMFR